MGVYIFILSIALIVAFFKIQAQGDRLKRLEYWTDGEKISKKQMSQDKAIKKMVEDIEELNKTVSRLDNEK